MAIVAMLYYPRNNHKTQKTHTQIYTKTNTHTNTIIYHSRNKIRLIIKQGTAKRFKKINIS